MDQDKRILELTGHVFRAGDEMRREIALVELHTLVQGDGGLEALTLFDRNHSILADLFHGLGDHGANLGIIVRGDGADLGNLRGFLDLDREILETSDERLDSLVDPAL